MFSSQLKFEREILKTRHTASTSTRWHFAFSAMVS